MSPEHAETAILAAAILTLLAIVAKLVTSNLVSRSKRNWGQLDLSRRGIVGRLKKAQLARTSAHGTLEFWQRRKTEASRRLLDLKRDLEAYVEQLGGGEDGEDETGSDDAGETTAVSQAEDEAVAGEESTHQDSVSDDSDEVSSAAFSESGDVAQSPAAAEEKVTCESESSQSQD